MKNYLNKYRYGAKRFWIKVDNEEWLVFSKNSIRVSLIRDEGLNEKQMLEVISFIKENSDTASDKDWEEEIEWLKYKGNKNVFYVFGHIEFVSPVTGKSTKSLSVKEFNKIAEKKFPSRGGLSEDGGFGIIK